MVFKETQETQTPHVVNLCFEKKKHDYGTMFDRRIDG